MAKQSVSAAERRKYEDMWRYSQYRNYSPGEQMIPVFKQLVRKRGTVIDLGCGTGRASLKLDEMGFEVTQLDFAKNCRDWEVMEKRYPFIRGCLWGSWKGRWDVGYCCDVMEHIPTEKIDVTLKKIMRHCSRAFFSIHFMEDNCGKLIGHPLHLTIEPYTWWRDKLREFGKLVDSRDMLGIGTFFLESRTC